MTEELDTILAGSGEAAESGGEHVEPAAAEGGGGGEDRPAEAAAAAAEPEPAEPAGSAPPPDPLEARLEAFGEKLIERLEHRQAVGRVAASEAAAKAKYADFEEKAAAFAKEAEKNPELIRQMAAAENPGEFAYGRGRQAIELAGVGSLDELKAKLRAEWEAEVKAALPRAAAPATTATQRSVGARGGPEWSGPRSIGDLLPPIG